MKSVLVATAGLVVAGAFAANSWAADTAASAAFEKVNHDFVTAWNAHDPARMAAAWSENADLINPFGAKAHGRAELEKLFEVEQHGVMKASTYTIESNAIREIGRGTAVQDVDSVITGMVGPDGKPLPAFRHHVVEIAVRRGGHWQVEFIRAYAIQPHP